MSYWKANKATEKKLRAAFAKWTDGRAVEARQICDRIGAKNFLFSAGFFSIRVSGFEFEQDPDKSLFKRMKGLPGCWTPKVRNPLFREMEKLECNCLKEVKEILGIGERLETPGIEFPDGCVLIEWCDKFHKDPIGCKRISDIKYEKLIGGKSECDK